MKVAVKNLQNEQVREIDLPETVFAYPYKEHLVHEVVRAVRAAERSGSHSTKTRAEVSGSGRKLWRQKGTGRARVGDIRNPKWRKGGIVHGPRPRSYETRMSAGEKRAALKSVLSRKLAENGVVVLEDFQLSSHKTAELARTLSSLGVEGKALLVDSRNNENLSRASANNAAVKAVDALAVNVYDVVDRPWFVVSEGALTRLLEVLSK